MIIDDTNSVVKLNHTDLNISDLRVLTDKISSQLFSCNKDIWVKLITTKESLSVLEKEPRSFYTADNKRKTSSKSVAELTVDLRISPGTNENIKQKIIENPLNTIDKLVLSACLSHQSEGHSYITVKTIFKYLGGARQPNNKFSQDIEDSIDKLRFIEIKMNVTQAYNNLQRLQKPDGTPIRTFRSAKKQSNLMDYLSELDPPESVKSSVSFILSDYLLPAKTLTAEVNGIRTTAIEFHSVSPLFLYAGDKGETTLLENKLLTPKLNNTALIICLKTYLLTRIKAIKRSHKGGGKSLEPVITFKSLYENCSNGQNAKTDRKFRKRIRETAFKYLTFLKENREIKQFTSMDKSNTHQVDLAKCVKFKIEWK